MPQKGVIMTLEPGQGDASPTETGDAEGKSIWQLLWDYDPNGLVVVDSSSLRVKLVNPAFCTIFQTTSARAIDRPLADLLGDIADFQEVLRTGQSIRGRVEHLPQLGLYVRKVVFAVPEQKLVAAIFVDVTSEQQQAAQLRRLKRETLRNVSEVVDKHMKAAQEIAGLLGETTAETKVSLLHLVKALEQEEPGPSQT